MSAFTEIALLMGLAAVLGIVANKLRQPQILGYILAGLILHAAGIFEHGSEERFELFSQIGIVFLLFILGLDLDLRELKKVGITSLATGLGQIFFTMIFGYVISTMLGYSPIVSLYLSIALTFSSTIVIVKLLSQKKDLDSLYGRISIGFLLIQDLAAIVILIMLSTLARTGGDPSTLPLEILTIAAKGMGLLALLIFISELVVPWVMDRTNKDREVLFISVIAWALCFSAFVAQPEIGFTLEVGALAAGIALSTRKESLQIESWTRPLRDFFITVFFVLLGLQVSIEDLNSLLVPGIIFSIFVLIGNPLIVMIIMGLLGYRSKVGFFSGLTVAQISEFSLLVAKMGLDQGHIKESEIALLTLVGGITMTLSSYMIFYNEQLYNLLKPLLSIFERKDVKLKNARRINSKGKIVVFGFNRLGIGLHDLIDNGDKKFLVVDNDPKMIARAESFGAKTVYGELGDTDLMKKLRLDDSELIVSTANDRSGNLQLLYFAEENNIETPIIVPADDDETAQLYYDQGASFVLYPHLFASQRLAYIVEQKNIDGSLANFANKEKSLLKNRMDYE